MLYSVCYIDSRSRSDMKLKLRNARKMLKGHYTKAEHLGDVKVPGANSLSFRDASTLYVSTVIGRSKPANGGIVTCTMDLKQKDFFTNSCSYYSVATGPDGFVAVRNGTANELEIYSQQPTKVLNMALPAGKHKGMAVNEKGDVYICDADSDCIRVYDSTGELTKVIQNKEIKRPQYIAFTNRGFVVTCIGDEPEVLHIDEDGEVRWSHDELEFPAGVAVDSNNDVYVCDAEESKVVMITHDGEYSFDLIDEHMLKHKQPFAVAVCDNKLAVQLLESDIVKLYHLTS